MIPFVCAKIMIRVARLVGRLESVTDKSVAKEKRMDYTYKFLIM